jgi:hypothetical protein
LEDFDVRGGCRAPKLYIIGGNGFYYDFVGEEFAVGTEVRLASEGPVHLGKCDAEFV